jgi:hypothetical protein
MLLRRDGLSACNLEQRTQDHASLTATERPMLLCGQELPGERGAT